MTCHALNIRLTESNDISVVSFFVMGSMHRSASHSLVDVESDIAAED